MRYEQFDNGHARYVTVRGAGPSKRFGLSPDQWDDRELLYEQVMHLGKSFEGGLYSDDDMAAAARLRTMEIPEGSTAATEYSKLVAERAPTSSASSSPSSRPSSGRRAPACSRCSPTW